MAYIESHQELGRHPKTRKAARLLGVSRPAIVGHLQYLWWWALDYAQDGDITDYENDELAEASLWDGDPAVFIAALLDAGFLDESDGHRRIHDWWDYAGRLIEQRRANARRQQEWRDRQREKPAPARNTENPTEPDGHNKHVTVTSPLRNGATVPYRTVADRTVPSSGEGGKKSDVVVARERASDGGSLPFDLSEACKRVAVAAKIDLPADQLEALVRQYWPHFGTNDLELHAQCAASWITNPEQNTKHSRMTLVFLRNWLAREVKRDQEDATAAAAAAQNGHLNGHAPPSFAHPARAAPAGLPPNARLPDGRNRPRNAVPQPLT
jgi:hypothetical protein